MSEKKFIETCFTPLLFPLYKKLDSVVVIVDIFRATTSICAAFENQVKEIVAVSEKSECIYYRDKGYLIAGERNGKLLDYADMGNSPDEFLESGLKGKSIAFNTTNGSRTIKMAASEENCTIVIGAFVNLDALSNFIIENNKDVLIFCSGWKDRFCLEDSLFAGALAENILKKSYDKYKISCDSTNAAIDMWQIAKSNPREYIDKAAHRYRLKHMKLDGVIDYCMSINVANVIPAVESGRIINISSK